MEDYPKQDNDAKMQIFGICRKLVTVVPPISLSSQKADETIRYWLPEIPISLINRYKKEFIEETTE